MLSRVGLNSRLAATSLGVGFCLFLVGTAITGSSDSVERESLVRARVWCESLVERDPLRFQESFRRNYFRGRFDRVANIYRDPTEASILAQMPETIGCRIAGSPRIEDDGEDVFVPVVRTAPGAETTRLELRMRREAGFWVVYQLIEAA